MSINPQKRLKSKSDLSSQESLNASRLSSSNLFDPLETPGRKATIAETSNIKLSIEEVKKTFEVVGKGEIPSPMLSRTKSGRVPAAKIKPAGERLKETKNIRSASEEELSTGKLTGLEYDYQLTKEELHKAETRMIALEVKNAALETKLADVTGQLESLEAASARLKEFESENTRALIARNEQLKTRNAALETKLLDAAKHFENLSAVHTKIKILEKTNNSLSSTNQTLEADLRSINQTVTLLQTQVDSLEKFKDADKLAQSFVASEREKDYALELLLQFQLRLLKAEEEIESLKNARGLPTDSTARQDELDSRFGRMETERQKLEAKVVALEKTVAENVEITERARKIEKTLEKFEQESGIVSDKEGVKTQLGIEERMAKLFKLKPIKTRHDAIAAESSVKDSAGTSPKLPLSSRIVNSYSFKKGATIINIDDSGSIDDKIAALVKAANEAIHSDDNRAAVTGSTETLSLGGSTTSEAEEKASAIRSASVKNATHTATVDAERSKSVKNSSLPKTETNPGKGKENLADAIKKKEMIKTASRELIDFFNEGPPEAGVKSKARARKNSIDEILDAPDDDPSLKSSKSKSKSGNLIPETSQMKTTPSKELIEIMKEGPPVTKSAKSVSTSSLTDFSFKKKSQPNLQPSVKSSTPPSVRTGLQPADAKLKQSASKDMIDLFNAGPPTGAPQKKKKVARRNSIDEILGSGSEPAPVEEKPKRAITGLQPADAKLKPTASREMMDFFNAGPPGATGSAKQKKVRKNSIDEILDSDEPQAESAKTVLPPAKKERANKLIPADAKIKESGSKDMIDFFNAGPPDSMKPKKRAVAKENSIDKIMGTETSKLSPSPSAARDWDKWEDQPERMIIVNPKKNMKKRRNSIDEILGEDIPSPSSSDAGIAKLIHKSASKELINFLHINSATPTMNTSNSNSEMNSPVPGAIQGITHQAQSIPLYQRESMAPTVIVRSISQETGISDKGGKPMTMTREMIKIFNEGPPDPTRNRNRVRKDASIEFQDERQSMISDILGYGSKNSVAQQHMSMPSSKKNSDDNLIKAQPIPEEGPLPVTPPQKKAVSSANRDFIDFLNEGPPAKGAVPSSKLRARKNSIDEILNGDSDEEASATKNPSQEAVKKPKESKNISPAKDVSPKITPENNLAASVQKKQMIKSASRELMDFLNEGPPEPGKKSKAKVRKNSLDEILGEEDTKSTTAQPSISSPSQTSNGAAPSPGSALSGSTRSSPKVDNGSSSKKSATRELMEFLREGPPDPKGSKQVKKKVKRDSIDSILGNSDISKINTEKSETSQNNSSGTGTADQKAANTVSELYDAPISPVTPPQSAYPQTATRELIKIFKEGPPGSNIVKVPSGIKKRDSIDDILDEDEKLSERKATQDMIKFFKEGPPPGVAQSKKQASDKSLKKSNSQSSFLPYSSF